ncbi:MAG TPA: response regulator transcription factor [Chloroflexota bacterium]|jgi:DNA-binding response OmpR family regulator|nr:response regulator transcription factor [Chloroflexota bacterium]
MAKILLVDDEPTLISTVGYNLRREGHQVVTAGDGVRALDLARRERPDLIVLDLLLPKMDGLDVCRSIRQSTSAALRAVPILMLTAKAEEVDKVVGLEVGADDYVTKPFSMRELMARLKAMLRRTQMELKEPETELPFVFGNLEINPAQRRISRRGKEITLKPKEFDLLVFLLRHPGQVFSREQLLDQVWGFGHIGDIRTVDVHIRWLREKIERDPSKPKLLETVRGVGYRVRAPQKGLVA